MLSLSRCSGRLRGGLSADDERLHGHDASGSERSGDNGHRLPLSGAEGKRGAQLDVAVSLDARGRDLRAPAQEDLSGRTRGLGDQDGANCRIRSRFECGAGDHRSGGQGAGRTSSARRAFDSGHSLLTSWALLTLGTLWTGRPGWSDGALWTRCLGRHRRYRISADTQASQTDDESSDHNWHDPRAAFGIPGSLWALRCRPVLEHLRRGWIRHDVLPPVVS